MHGFFPKTPEQFAAYLAEAAPGLLASSSKKLTVKQALLVLRLLHAPTVACVNVEAVTMALAQAEYDSKREELLLHHGLDYYSYYYNPEGIQVKYNTGSRSSSSSSPTTYHHEDIQHKVKNVAAQSRGQRIAVGEEGGENTPDRLLLLNRAHCLAAAEGFDGAASPGEVRAVAVGADNQMPGPRGTTILAPTATGHLRNDMPHIKAALAPSQDAQRVPTVMELLYNQQLQVRLVQLGGQHAVTAAFLRLLGTLHEAANPSWLASCESGKNIRCRSLNP
jgi:hypothetical protein